MVFLKKQSIERSLDCQAQYKNCWDMPVMIIIIEYMSNSKNSQIKFLELDQFNSIYFYIFLSFGLICKRRNMFKKLSLEKITKFIY